MAFYSQIAKVYDVLFPLNKQQLEFTESILGKNLNGKKVLDIGCGTGSLSIALARKSCKVRAFDYDAEMVALCNEKRPQALDLVFKQGDMLNVSKVYSGILFNAVLCYGNTLVHLQSDREVNDFFQNIAKLLIPGGSFIFSIVNYDRVLLNNVDSLPAIECGDYTFIRKYNHRSDGKIDFNTVLTTSDGDAVENSVVLLPMTKVEVEDILKRYFSSIRCYGGFDRTKWSSESFHLVVEAVK